MEQINAVENLIDEIITYGWRKHAAGKTSACDPARSEEHERIAIQQMERIRDLLERPF